MKYYDGYKFVVAEQFSVMTDIRGFYVSDRLSELTGDGKLTISQWYPWNGNSGPFPDTKSTIKASCVHDILSDYVNMGWLPQYLQPIIDNEYYKIAVEHGMWWRVARWLMLAIRWYMTGKGAKRYSREILEDKDDS